MHKLIANMYKDKRFSNTKWYLIQPTNDLRIIKNIFIKNRLSRNQRLTRGNLLNSKPEITLKVSKILAKTTSKRESLYFEQYV